MATITFSGLSCVDDALVLTGTSAGVAADNTIWVQIGDEWFKPKVDAATGDWRLVISHDEAEGLGIGDGESADISAGVYLHPAHRPHVGAHKVLVDPNAIDTGTLTNTAEGANLLANGGFESIANPLAANTWAIVPVPGWTGTDGGIEVWNDLTDHGPAAFEGSQNIELDSDARVDVVSQAVATVTGAEYEISFAYASRFATAGADDTTDAFTVWWNGVQVGAFDPSVADWTTATLTVTGGGGGLLEFREAGANDGLGALIDAVAVTATDDCVGFILA
jgi:hypothetical protein